MLSRRTRYSIQLAVILSIFFFVLFNLVFKLIVDLRSESMQKEAEEAKIQRERLAFTVHIEDHYEELQRLYQAKEYEKAIEIIKLFNVHEKPDYKNLPEIKKQIRLVYLKKKLDFIPKIQLDEYMQLSKDIDIEEGLKKVKEAVKLIKQSKERLAEIENEFEEISKEIELDEEKTV